MTSTQHDELVELVQIVLSRTRGAAPSPSLARRYWWARESTSNLQERQLWHALMVLAESIERGEEVRVELVNGLSLTTSERTV